MVITVQVRQPAPPDALEQIAAAAGVSGASLRPVVPGTTDPQMSTYYLLDVPDSKVEDALARLRNHPAVVAAYTKPVDQLP